MEITYEKLALFHECDSKENMVDLIEHLLTDDNEEIITQFLLDTSDLLCDLSQDQYKDLKANSDEDNPFLTEGLSLQETKYYPSDLPDDTAAS